MQKQNRIIGTLTAILVGALIAVGVQAFSQPGNPNSQSATSAEYLTHEQSGIVSSELYTEAEKDDDEQDDAEQDDEPVPMQSSRGPGLVDVHDDPEITVIPENKGPVPTAEPLGAAPAAVALAADEKVVFENDFSSAELPGWTFGQTHWEPLPPPAWEVVTNQYVEEVLVATQNKGGMSPVNDTVAVVPVALSGDSAIEVSAQAGTAAQMGLVVGYEDEQNFTAMIFGSSDADGICSPGVMLMQMVDGTPTVLEHNPKMLMQRDQWYTLRLAIAGDTINAYVDGEPVLTASLATPLAGAQPGLYAGSDGYVFFDNMRVVEK